MTEAAKIIAGALDGVAISLDGVARAIIALGNNDAATSMGAIEALGKEVRDGFSGVATTLDGVANALDRIPGQ